MPHSVSFPHVSYVSTPLFRIGLPIICSMNAGTLVITRSDIVFFERVCKYPRHNFHPSRVSTKLLDDWWLPRSYVLCNLTKSQCLSCKRWEYYLDCKNETHIRPHYIRHLVFSFTSILDCNQCLQLNCLYFVQFCRSLLRRLSNKMHIYCDVPWSVTSVQSQLLAAYYY